MIQPRDIASLTGNEISTQNMAPTGISGKAKNPNAMLLSMNQTNFPDGKVQTYGIHTRQHAPTSILKMSKYLGYLSRIIPIRKDPTIPATIKPPPARAISETE